MDQTPRSRRNVNFTTPRKNKATFNDKSNGTCTPNKPLITPKPNSSKRLMKQYDSTKNTNDNDHIKISVSVRVRPPPQNSKDDNYCIAKSLDTDIHVKNPVTQSKDTTNENVLVFSYDHVFWFNESEPEDEQQLIFETLAIPLLNASLDGYNACLFAYGQTGSGKTYSIMDADGTFSSNGMGIIPRFCKELLKRKENVDNSFTVNISYYEIYNEKIYDLLKEDSKDNNERTNLKVREHPLNGPYVADLAIFPVNSINEVLKQLKSGNRRRMTGATLNNERSSRSHTIFDITLSKSSGEQSKVRLVDLAGSERVSQCSTTEERFREGLSINKSLLTLGKVITALAEKKKRVYIPYRESQLTWLLKDCLGGNSRTCMLATISPSQCSIDETLSTLRWANKARSIICNITKNEDPQMRLIVELQNEVKRLKELRSDLSAEDSKIAWITVDDLQTKLDIEKQQRSVEEKLQTELAKLEMNLNQAEQEKNELETQRNIILLEANENIPPYESDFYESIKNILNCSINDSFLDCSHQSLNDTVSSTKELKEKYLNKMKRLAECLKSLYKTEISLDDNKIVHVSHAPYMLMSEIEERLDKILGEESDL